MTAHPGKKKVIIGLAILLALCAFGILAFIYFRPAQHTTVMMPDGKSEPSTEEIAPKDKTSYAGQPITVANTFTVKVPNGWTASTSEATTFTAIMFASPEHLQSLVYNESINPTVQSGIAPWSGLTEHFFILAPKPSSQFNPADHQEVTSEPFTFDDGVVGQKYLVIKHAEEAKRWGGLLRDTEWQGRTYIYEHNGIRVEAHIAVYPSSKLDIPFFESVVRTITVGSQ
jgi:hypothetical protein